MLVKCLKAPKPAPCLAKFPSQKVKQKPLEQLLGRLNIMNDLKLSLFTYLISIWLVTTFEFRLP